MRIEEKYGAMVRASRWTQMAIDVFWENPTATSDANRDLVRKAIKETWEANSAIVFPATWPACVASAKGIRIKISDEGSHTASLGRYLDARPAGMVLNFAFQQWGQACQANPQSCMYSIAVHEFGHALGFTHEDNRKDTPDQCKADYHQGIDGDYYVTPYDANSVMNYCNKTYLGDGKLSPFDIKMVSEIYKKTP